VAALVHPDGLKLSGLPGTVGTVDGSTGVEGLALGVLENQASARPERSRWAMRCSRRTLGMGTVRLPARLFGSTKAPLASRLRSKGRGPQRLVFLGQ
jgi:hypothetical protein